MDTSENNKNESVQPEPQMQCDKTPKIGIGDILLAAFLFPVVGAFLPWTRDSVSTGLDLIKEIPDWFSFIIVLIVISAVGLRKYIVDILERHSNRNKG